MPRYTIEMSIHEVEDDGYVDSGEIEGCTAEWACTSLAAITLILDMARDTTNDVLAALVDTEEVTPRRPEGT